MNNLTRREAITIIAKQEIEKLTPEEREAILLNWWYIDNGDEEYSLLTDDVKADMKSYESPPDLTDKRYNILISFNYLYEYRGVKSSFIKAKVEGILKRKVSIEGEAESLVECSCCHYRTLDESGAYDICPVCFWEDDGNREPAQYSSCNRLTLKEARENFSSYGACDRESRSFVSRDNPEEKFFREE